MKPKEVKKNASDITFGRKPMGFSNKNKKGTGFAGAKDDFVALDDIEKIDNKKDKK